MRGGNSAYAAGCSGEFSFRDGFQFTASSLWSKARRHLSVTQPASPRTHCTASAGVMKLPNMPTSHPQANAGRVGDAWNYDLHCVNLFNHRQSETARQDTKSTSGPGRGRGRSSSTASLMGAGLETGPVTGGLYTGAGAPSANPTDVFPTVSGSMTSGGAPGGWGRTH